MQRTSNAFSTHIDEHLQEKACASERLFFDKAFPCYTSIRNNQKSLNSDSKCGRDYKVSKNKKEYEHTLMHCTIFDTPILTRILKGLSIRILRICGWRREGRLPSIPKYVMIVAPHTSNWDMLVGMMIALSFVLKLSWLAKESLFRWPFVGFMKWLGGIPIDRSKSSNVVAQSIQTFKENREVVLVVAPEGTRKNANYWKTGFYHIANGANVPIVMGFIDYAQKVGGIGPTLIPTGDIEFDVQKIRFFYDKITGKIPDNSTPAVIAPRS